MSDRHWQRHSYLDVLRPDAGWQVAHAILTTYSADLVALVAAMLALAGIEDDEDAATKVDFANAFERMRGRLRVLLQGGRLAGPKRHTPVLSILDRFIREVAHDEAQGSWHPKIALLKFVKPGENDRWRLWIGSRNLTRSTAWEAGLVLSGAVNAAGADIAGIPELGSEIARLAELPGLSETQIFAELTQVRWEVPAGMEVESVCLLLAPTRSYPPAPGSVDELIVVSPFLDIGTLRYFASWSDQPAKRTLVSMQSELAALYAISPQVGKEWRLLHLAAPPPEEIEIVKNVEPPTEIASSPEPDNDEMADVVAEKQAWEENVLEPIGLHAKLVFARQGERRWLWLGSANATGRGWCGPNTEVVAHLAITAETAVGLQTFVNEVAQTVAESALASLAAEEHVAEAEELLEKARTEVAARWAVIQERDDGAYHLVAAEAPHPADPRIELRVGLFGSELKIWPRGVKRLILPRQTGIESELVRVQLRLDELRLNWLQRAPLTPPPDEDRDHRALAQHLDPRTFLMWIRSLLGGGDPGDGGGAWHEVGSRRHGRDGGAFWWAPTLEELLQSWSRRPESLQQVDRKVQQYLTYLQADAMPQSDAKEREIIAEFARTWETVRRVMVDVTHE